jgi:hypothetical protein
LQSYRFWPISQNPLHWKLPPHYWMNCDAVGTGTFLIASSLQWYADCQVN